MLSIFECLMSTNKIKNGVDLSFQTILFDEVLGRFSYWNDIFFRYAQSFGFIKQFLSNIRNYHSCPNVTHNLESIEAQSTKTEQKYSLMLFDFSSPSDGVKGCIHSVSGHSSFCWADALWNFDRRSDIDSSIWCVKAVLTNARVVASFTQLS